ncbi:MAG TPA: hemolysin family protein [Polyangia bacterium]|jgi:putative hemolysin|nr:hemolysin family protein [Polyangia bacterium]
MILTELITILALIVANGVLAGAEIAIVSLRHTRLQQMVDEDRVGARTVSALRAEPERFFATVQVGITVVTTTAAAFGGARMAQQFEPYLRPLPFVGRDANGVALALVVVLVSFLSLVLGELVPKSLALRHGERYALLVAKPIAALSRIAKPIVWLLTAISNLILRPFSDRTNFSESRISKEELEQIVDEAAKTGAIHEHASELATRALDFDRLTLGDVMLPRVRIDALPLHATMEQIRRFLLEERRSRIPVYDRSLDDIVGYVSAKDIVSLAWDGGPVVLSDLLRNVKFFPDTVSAIEVLRYMQRESQRIVIALDEHGVVSGMVTFEDLFEELVGDILGEHEENVPPLTREPDGSVVARGDTPIRDINRELDIALEEPEGVTTIAGLSAALAGGGIPNRNARLAAGDGSVLVVLEASPRVVKRVRIIPARHVTNHPAPA